MSSRPFLITVFALILVLGTLATLFSLQNGARTVELSLDLGFAAWRLKDPVSVPTLVGAAFGSGLLAAVALRLLWALRPAPKVAAASSWE
ncbi:MAG: hypothetical protein JXX28_15595 [Deltaproteobacteria bacterium]|nr:hypothetical protein [Deltaproteobacteria bacterium]